MSVTTLVPNALPGRPGGPYSKAPPTPDKQVTQLQTYGGPGQRYGFIRRPFFLVPKVFRLVASPSGSFILVADRQIQFILVADQVATFSLEV